MSAIRTKLMNNFGKFRFVRVEIKCSTQNKNSSIIIFVRLKRKNYLISTNVYPKFCIRAQDFCSSLAAITLRCSDILQTRAPLKKYHSENAVNTEPFELRIHCKKHISAYSFHVYPSWFYEYDDVRLYMVFQELVQEIQRNKWCIQIGLYLPMKAIYFAFNLVASFYTFCAHIQIFTSS